MKVEETSEVEVLRTSSSDALRMTIFVWVADWEIWELGFSA